MQREKQLTLIERERFEERAAIMEYHGGLSRAEAERKALASVTEKPKPAQSQLFPK